MVIPRIIANFPQNNNTKLEQNVLNNDEIVSIRLRNGDEIILQSRPQYYEEYLQDSHDERDLIPDIKRSTIIVNDDDDESETEIKHSPRRYSQAQQWLLNQRQGEDIERIAERNPEPELPSREGQLSSSLAGEAYNLIPHLSRYQDTSNDGMDYFESLEYQESQMAEEEDDKPQPGYKIAQKRSLPNLNAVKSSRQSTIGVPVYHKTYNTSSSIYHVDIPTLTMPQELLQTSTEPPLSRGINVIPQLPLESFPPSNYDHVLSAAAEPMRIVPKSEIRSTLNTKSQVGMSESILRMNVPLFIQNNMGPNASWI